MPWTPRAFEHEATMCDSGQAAGTALWHAAKAAGRSSQQQQPRCSQMSVDDIFPMMTLWVVYIYRKAASRAIAARQPTSFACDPTSGTTVSRRSWHSADDALGAFEVWPKRNSDWRKWRIMDHQRTWCCQVSAPAVVQRFSVGALMSTRADHGCYTAGCYTTQKEQNATRP